MNRHNEQYIPFITKHTQCTQFPSYRCHPERRRLQPPQSKDPYPHRPSSRVERRFSAASTAPLPLVIPTEDFSPSGGICVLICHPERRFGRHSDRTGVEGPLYQVVILTCDRRTFVRVSFGSSC